MQRFRGCRTQPQASFEFEGWKLSRCPVRLVTVSTWRWITLYRYYRKGFLLMDGGLLKQPWPYLQAMQVIGGEMEKYIRGKIEQ